MGISGAAAAAKAIETTWHRAGYCLEWAWYDVYKPVGARTGMSAGTALEAAGMSGQMHTDTTPPAGAAVWYGVRGDGNRDGDACVSIGGGQVRALGGSGDIYTVGVMARAGHINREYLGWTASIFDVAIDLDGAAISDEDWPARARYGEDWVRAIQEKLNRLGYSLDVDGKDGPATQAAVRDFQSKNGLEVDGIAGPDTNAKLDAQGQPSGKLDVDGQEGPATISREQEYLGVTVDGQRGPQTISAEQTLTGATVDRQDGPDTARHLQAYLHGLGYGDIVGAIDGDRGPATIRGLQTALNDGAFGRQVTTPAPIPEPADQPVTPRTPTYPGAAAAYTVPLGDGDRPAGQVIDRLIVHHTATTADQEAYFSTRNERESCPTWYAHADGRVVEFIEPSMRPCSTGAANARSVAVETQNTSGAPEWGISPASHEAIAHLAAWLSQQTSFGSHSVQISLDRQHIIGHNEAGVNATACPGPSMDLDWIVARARDIVASAQPDPEPATPDPVYPTPEPDDPAPETPEEIPVPEKPDYTPPAQPAEVSPAGVASAIGTVIKSVRARAVLYSSIVLGASAVWTTSEVADAVSVAIAAGLSPLDVALAGAKAGFGYILPLVGGLAIANLPKKEA